MRVLGWFSSCCEVIAVKTCKCCQCQIIAANATLTLKLHDYDFVAGCTECLNSFSIFKVILWLNNIYMQKKDSTFGSEEYATAQNCTKIYIQ